MVNQNPYQGLRLVTWRSPRDFTYDEALTLFYKVRESMCGERERWSDRERMCVCVCSSDAFPWQGRRGKAKPPSLSHSLDVGPGDMLSARKVISLITGVIRSQLI